MKGLAEKEGFEGLTVDELKEYHQNLETVGEVMLEKALSEKATSEEVAELTYFLCNPNMRHLTGTEINLDGGKKSTI